MCNQKTYETKLNHYYHVNNDSNSILYRLESLARARWSLIKCAVKLLSLHKRAVITANHPIRKQLRGEFDVEF